MDAAAGIISFEIDIEPKSMANEIRFSRFGTYSTRRKKDYHARIRLLCDEHEPEELMEGPIRASFVFLLPRPRNRYRRRDHEEAIWTPSRPDYDNLVKAFVDAMNGRFFKDDSQLCDVRIRKAYHEKEGIPRVIITLQLIEERICEL